jgi:hypothetical protein
LVSTQSLDDPPEIAALGKHWQGQTIAVMHRHTLPLTLARKVPGIADIVGS